MNSEQIRAVTECAELSGAGKIHFGEIIRRLMTAGIERYHADYCRSENTYYLPDGDSFIVSMEHQQVSVAQDFSASAVEAAVGQAQRGEIMYPEFTRQAVAAGCVGYFVQISGRCVQYFGRNGEIHTEWFPGAKNL